MNSSHGVGSPHDRLVTLTDGEKQARKTAIIPRLDGDYAQMIIHDLKTPLNTILLTLDVLRQKNHLPKSQQNLLRQAARSGETMMSMIQNLLDLGRIGHKPAIQTMPVAIDQFLVTTMVRLSESGLFGPRVLLFTNRAPAVGVTIDPELMRRVLTNLLDNAVKHTAEDGTIEVRLEKRQREVLIAVIDNGSGIPHDFLPKIFGKFERADTPGAHAGSGLGLAFCKLAVEVHGGRIRVESQRGHGSSFYIHLPLTEKRQNSGSTPKTRRLPMAGLIKSPTRLETVENQSQ